MHSVGRREVLKLAAALALPGCAARAQSTTSVASARVLFRRIHGALDTALDAAEARLQREWDGRRHAVVHGTNLFLANCHRGEELLRPHALVGVAMVLDQMRQLGIGGVTVALSYPLGMPDFPDPGARSEAWWAYYESVAAAVRARGMKLNVESGVMFGVGGFTALPVADYYARLRNHADPLREYVRGRIQVLEEIAQRLRPDTLSFGAEPDVAAALVGLPQIARIGFNHAFAAEVVAAIKPIAPSMLCGTGVGSWLADAEAFVARYGSIRALDYIDLHVYPVHRGALDRAFDLARQARTLGKRLVVSEAWLYKDDGAVAGGGNVWAEVLSRNVYDFWVPLDQRFHAVMVKWAHAAQIDYIAPFVALQYFAYVPTDPTTLALTPAERDLLLARRALAVIQANARDASKPAFSPTGIAYRDLILHGPR